MEYIVIMKRRKQGAVLLMAVCMLMLTTWVLAGQQPVKPLKSLDAFKERFFNIAKQCLSAPLPLDHTSFVTERAKKLPARSVTFSMNHDQLCPDGHCQQNLTSY